MTNILKISKDENSVGTAYNLSSTKRVYIKILKNKTSTSYALAIDDQVTDVKSKDLARIIDLFSDVLNLMSSSHPNGARAVIYTEGMFYKRVDTF